jgi:hypothetical protein
MQVKLCEEDAKRILQWSLGSSPRNKYNTTNFRGRSFSKSRFPKPMTQHRVLMQGRESLLTIMRLKVGVRDRVSVDETTKWD